MTSLAAPAEAGLERHSLASVTPLAWGAVLATRPDLRAEPLAVQWVDRGFPLIARRPMPGEAGGVPLGLPLPPSCGKRRLSVLLQWPEIAAIAAPPSLEDGRRAAPPAWQPILDRILLLPSLGDEPRCFGSLAWATLTKLDFLGPASDLDLILAPKDMRDAGALAEQLAAIERDAPMRLDGEIVRPDGAAVNWREIHGGAGDLLVKSRASAALWTRERFLGGGP